MAEKQTAPKVAPSTNPVIDASMTGLPPFPQPTGNNIIAAGPVAFTPKAP